MLVKKEKWAEGRRRKGGTAGRKGEGRERGREGEQGGREKGGRGGEHTFWTELVSGLLVRRLRVSQPHQFSPMSALSSPHPLRPSLISTASASAV